MSLLVPEVHAVSRRVLVSFLPSVPVAWVIAHPTPCSRNACEVLYSVTGVPSAIVAVRAVEYLSRMLLNKSEQVRGNAAIALGYLSYNHAGERHLLHK